MNLKFFLRLLCVCFIIIANNGNVGLGGTVANAKSNQPGVLFTSSPDIAEANEAFDLFDAQINLAPPSGILSGSNARFNGPDSNCYYKTKVLGEIPFAYWQFDETSGSTVSNVGSLGNVISGTLTAGVTLNQTGLIVDDTNPAASFDGISGTINIPNHSQINTSPSNYTSKTIELWFKADTLSGKQILYEQGGDLSGLNIFLDGSVLYAGAWTTAASILHSAWVTTVITTSQSYYVALVFDGGSYKVTGYLNNTSFGSQDTSFNEITGNVTPRGIGIGGINDYTRYPSGPDTSASGDNFDGAIDEVALYNRVLPASRLLRHASGCTQYYCDHQDAVGSDFPIAFWRMGETSGNTVSNIGTVGIAVNGTFTDGVTLGQTGLIAGDSDLAAGFNGLTGTISVPNNPAINYPGPLGGYTAKTIELWFKANTLSGKQVLYEQGGGSNGLNIFLKDWTLYAGAWIIGKETWVTTVITTSQSYYVALVFDGNTQMITGTLNGATFDSAATGFSSIPQHDGGIGIGGINNKTRFPPNYYDPRAKGDYFHGVIDEVALYNVVLPASRIQAHYWGSCSPTAVTLADFIATPFWGEVQVTWETIMELDAIGFNLFRSINPDGKQVRLNADLIPSKAPGGIIGASYEYLDKDVRAGQKYYYWLEFIDTDGKTVYGPRQVKATHGLFMPAIFH